MFVLTNPHSSLYHGVLPRAANLRKLLLGGGEDEGSEDDFFMASDDDEGKGGYGSDLNSSDDDDMEEGETDKVMTFMPTPSADDEVDGEPKKKSKKQKKAEKKAQQEDWEVPQDTLKRLREEKRSEGKKSKRSRATAAADSDDEKKNTDLELLFAGDEDSDEEGRDRLNFTKKQLAVAEDLKQSGRNDAAKKKRKLSKSKAKLLAETETDDFKLDMTDNRFSKVLEGDADFGIDRLSNEYRPTAAMEMILDERNNRKIAADKAGDTGGKSAVAKNMRNAAAGEEAGVNAKKLSQLASKLKKNFNKK